MTTVTKIVGALVLLILSQASLAEGGRSRLTVEFGPQEKLEVIKCSLQASESPKLSDLVTDIVETGFGQAFDSNVSCDGNLEQWIFSGRASTNIQVDHGFSSFFKDEMDTECRNGRCRTLSHQQAVEIKLWSMMISSTFEVQILQVGPQQYSVQLTPPRGQMTAVFEVPN